MSICWAKKCHKVSIGWCSGCRRIAFCSQQCYHRNRYNHQCTQEFKYHIIDIDSKTHTKFTKSIKNNILFTKINVNIDTNGKTIKYERSSQMIEPHKFKIELKRGRQIYKRKQNIMELDKISHQICKTEKNTRKRQILLQFNNYCRERLIKAVKLLANPNYIHTQNNRNMRTCNVCNKVEEKHRCVDCSEKYHLKCWLCSRRCNKMHHKIYHCVYV